MSPLEDRFGHVNHHDHPPPRYAEATSPRNSRLSEQSTKTVNFHQGPWLLRRTSIVIESEPSDDRSLSRISTTSTERYAKNPCGRKQTNLSQAWHSPQPFDMGFGVKVSIEAGNNHIKDRKHDMKGLEQAASVQRWPGGNRPGEAWGKLSKDPELWDANGDTLVYFGYQRTEASFRVRSAMLEDVGSEVLTSKLQGGQRRGNQPASIAASSTSSTRKGFFAPSISQQSTESYDGIRYEIYFPAPSDASRVDILRHHLTTRNFFALLLARPLVGLTFFQALIDLHERIRLYNPRDPNAALTIIKCLMENNLHNVCNDPAAAAGLLAWSEDEEVCWQEGWREGFVHCSGMYSQLRRLPEYRDLSHTSRALLERAHLERQVRLQETEDRLVSFEFGDMWPESVSHLRTWRSSFDRFRGFLQEFYEREYRSWPPKAALLGSDASWLSRSLVVRLQSDCDALYDYLVDRDIVWDTSKGRELIRGSTGGSDSFLAEIFYRFDQRHKIGHIPHPYPLLPSSMPDGQQKSKSGLFGSKTKALEKRIAHAYAEASNLPAHRKTTDMMANTLVEAFTIFEKTDHPADIDLGAARKGRWMLLYGLLQTLSRVSIDTPDLYFTGDVSYFLNPRLKGTPPWSYGSGNVYEEAQPRMAHVFQT